jgi:hypothetical protein
MPSFRRRAPRRATGGVYRPISRTGINQGDALLGMASINWLKIVLTYCVPYAVCTYGAVSYHLKKAEAPIKRGT